jgi:hypothetical protein
VLQQDLAVMPALVALVAQAHSLTLAQLAAQAVMAVLVLKRQMHTQQAALAVTAAKAVPHSSLLQQAMAVMAAPAAWVALLVVMVEMVVQPSPGSAPLAAVTAATLGLWVQRLAPASSWVMQA